MSETREDDNWREWAGGDCPLTHDAEVVVKWRNGQKWSAQASGFQWHHSPDGRPRPYDIVAYMPLPLPADHHPA